MDIATNSQSNSYDGEMINRLFLDLAAVMPMKLGIRLLKWEGMIIGEKTDISNMVEFLLSEKSRWITGQEFVVDGGLTSN